MRFQLANCRCINLPEFLPLSIFYYAYLSVSQSYHFIIGLLFVSSHLTCLHLRRIHFSHRQINPPPFIMVRFAEILLLAPLLGLAAAGNVNTADVHIFTDGDCQNQIEVGTFGTIDECHAANGVFNSVSLSNVGQNLFGRGIRLFIFRNSDCSGPNTNIKLSIHPVCFTLAEGASFRLQLN